MLSIKEEDWEKALSEPVDRVVIAGGDGTVSRLAPWLAGRKIPFCILPLGTANNCARSLGQMHTVESIIAGLRSERIKAAGSRHRHQFSRPPHIYRSTRDRPSSKVYE